ncbi:preprotein translocase subunit YajC [Oleiharenicola lentus]|jgi:preprotein translocase subunit YajC|uniref:Sec translocon accessory complex subunit YajC n=1 Tax=Oleiharenicola lentus TaxID=2508720 RepID=A0A4Q1CBH8_9BACT|nr:preprotein translocase subunit YajC [Oleiharenicola lentus]RXK56262.1 preprotein translocase subunit YajC [Oleiharenicola lentus]
MTKISLLIAQAAPASPAAPGGAGSLMQFLPLVLMFAAMYFLLIAPQRKKQKEHEKMLAALAAGDEVVTAGGIYGEITQVKDDRFVVRIGHDNVKVEIGKGFISALVKKA